MLGHHLLLDLYDCDIEALSSSAILHETLHALAQAVGAQVLKVSTHEFDPQGHTCIAIVSASHIAMHTWPENHFLAVDLFSCMSIINQDRVTEILQQRFRSGSIRSRDTFRGEGLESVHFSPIVS